VAEINPETNFAKISFNLNFKAMGVTFTLFLSSIAGIAASFSKNLTVLKTSSLFFIIFLISVILIQCTDIIATIVTSFSSGNQRMIFSSIVASFVLFICCVLPCIVGIISTIFHFIKIRRVNRRVENEKEVYSNLEEFENSFKEEEIKD
jgi:hypothetical protein